MQLKLDNMEVGEALDLFGEQEEAGAPLVQFFESALLDDNISQGDNEYDMNGSSSPSSSEMGSDMAEGSNDEVRAVRTMTMKLRRP